MTRQAIEGVSRETLETLSAFEEMVRKWTKTINLVAPSTVSQIWDRHIVDSIQVYDAAPKAWSRWIDIGSGGGFPGAVVSIMNDDPDREVVLIESDKRKSLFLKQVQRELGLRHVVIAERLEAVETAPADVLSARALASLTRLLECSNHLRHTDTVCIFPKGAKYASEIDEALEDWDFSIAQRQSVTNQDSQILMLSGIRPRES